MRYRRRWARPISEKINLRPATRAGRIRLRLFLITALVFVTLVPSSIYLRAISSQMADAMATDLVVSMVNDELSRILVREGYGYDYFVTLEKDNDGNITAITTNMARINALSSELINEVLKTTSEGDLDIEIPLGNLLGLNTMLGRGPQIPVEVILLTSSNISFKNDFVASGINQTKHVIMLEVLVDIYLLIPWETVSTSIKTEVLVAETVIIGPVPQTYVNLE